MSLFRNLIFIILCASIFWSCITRYHYLSKVRVGKVPKQETKNKIAEQHVITNESSEFDKNVIASNDSSPDLNCFRSNFIPKVKLFPPFQLQIIADKSDNKQAKKKTVDSSIPINIFAKWSLILGIVGLFSYPLIIPCIIGPILIYASIKALKQIKLSKERGKGWAVFGLITGVLTSCLLAALVIALIVDLGWLSGLIFLMAIALINYILYRLLSFQRTKALYTEPINKSRNSNLKTKSNYFIRILLGTLITMAILFAILILLTGGPVAPGVLILVSLFLVITFNYSMNISPKKENENYKYKEKIERNGFHKLFLFIGIVATAILVIILIYIAGMAIGYGII